MKVTVAYIENIKSLLKVDSAVYFGDYRIKIKFSDEAERVVDFLPFLQKAIHPEIKKYLDAELFRGFQVIDGNINWNDYELIFPISSLRAGEI